MRKFGWERQTSGLVVSVRRAVGRGRRPGGDPLAAAGELVPKAVGPVLRRGLVIHITLAAREEARRAEGFEPGIKLLWRAAKIRIGLVTQAEHSELEMLEAGRGVGVEPGPEVGGVVRGIARPTAELIAAIAQRAPASDLAALLAPEHADDLKKWLWGRDVMDVLTLLASPMPVPDFVAVLRKMSPRLYSISSSPRAHSAEVHLTVSAVRYEHLGRRRKGVASTYLADRVSEAERVKVFVHASPGFKLPADASAPVIMVGPGTGIAPFRAFLQERQATGAPGKNWLFFGDQRRATDFLYEDQLTAWHESGHLARLDLAFSRDQAQKLYVQDRMREQSAELWSWLEAGAYFYVCGDAKRMAKDVDQALHQTIQTAGGKSSDEATAYIARLKTEKRYQRDVY